MRIMEEGFFDVSAPELAKKLIGKFLCRKIDLRIVRGLINEVEAYTEFDSACHAYKSQTERNRVMFDKGGLVYVYLCYGIHEMLNIVAGPCGSAQAVLIRGVDSYSGPGRVTKAFSIGRELYGEDLTTSDQIWLEDEGVKLQVEASRRIGIDYAKEEDRERLWRFRAVD